MSMSNRLQPEQLAKQHALHHQQPAEWYLECLYQRIQQQPLSTLYDLDVQDLMPHADEATRRWITEQFFQAGWTEACFHVTTRNGVQVVERFTLHQ